MPSNFSYKVNGTLQILAKLLEVIFLRFSLDGPQKLMWCVREIILAYLNEIEEHYDPGLAEERSQVQNLIPVLLQSLD